MQTAIAIIMGIVPATLLFAVVIFVLVVLITGLATPFAALAGSIAKRRRSHVLGMKPARTSKPASTGLGRPALRH